MHVRISSSLVCECVSSPLFLMLLFELIGSILAKQAHAQRAGEASTDTLQSGRRPCSPPLCCTTSQDWPLTTTMLIEDLIRRPCRAKQTEAGTGLEGTGWQAWGGWDPYSPALNTQHRHYQLLVWSIFCVKHFNTELWWRVWQVSLKYVK